MSLLFIASSLIWVLWYHLCWSLTSRPSLLQSMPHIPETVVISHPSPNISLTTHTVYITQAPDSGSQGPSQSGHHLLCQLCFLPPTSHPSYICNAKKKKCLMCWDYSRSNRGNRQNQQAIIVPSGYGNGEWWEQDLQISTPPQTFTNPPLPSPDSCLTPWFPCCISSALSLYNILHSIPYAFFTVEHRLVWEKKWDLLIFCLPKTWME